MSAFTSGSTYTRKQLRMLTVRWVAGRCRPMSIVSDPEFLKIVRMLNPQAEVPSRNTVAQDIKAIYLMANANLKNILQVSIPSIAHITTLM
jgi:hypothetical protein